MTDSPTTSPRSRSGVVRTALGRAFSRPGSTRALLELAALCGLAVVQPVLDVMGDAPEFFLFRRADRVDIILLAVSLAVVPPVALWVLESVVRGAGGDRAGRFAHRVIVAGLAATLGMQVAKQLVDRRGGWIVAAGVVAALVGVLALHNQHVRLWLRYLAFAPLAFVLLFLAASPVSDLVLPAGGDEPAAEASGASRAPVVTVVLDEFPLTALLGPDGTVDSRLYPNFARLAERSTFYRNTTTVSPSTPVAVPTLLTGRVPRQQLAPTAAQYPRNLFTLLGVSHEMEVHELVTAICPTGLCPLEDTGAPGSSVASLLGDAARVWRDLVSPSEAGTANPAQTFVERTVAEDDGADGRPQPESSTDAGFLMKTSHTPARFEAFLEGFRRGEDATLHFLHLLLPHQPWRYLPSGVTFDFKDPRKSGERWTAETWPFEEARQRLLLQTVYVDRLLGRLVERLEATELWDRALFVLASDHGVSLQPGEHDRAAVPAALPDLLWVPFFVKAPGQDAGRIDDRNALTVDVLPTIADHLGVDPPSDVDGVSVAGPDRREGPEKLFFPLPGQELRLDPSPWFPEAVLAGMATGRTRPERGPSGLYAIGPHGDLVGRRVAEVTLASASGARAAVERPGRYDSVKRRAPRVPAQVRGRLTSVGTGGEPSWVALSLNGTIAGMAGVYGGDELRFHGMVDEALLREGANRLDLFLVRGEPGDARLEPVEIA